MPQLGEIYIADLNRFNIPAPPLWWQQGLWSFDEDLRILPSRTRAVVWLARVQKYSRGLTGAAITDDQNDTAMFVKYELIPVTWVGYVNGVIDWTEQFLQHIVGSLMERDTWAIEGGPLTEDLIKKILFEGEGSKFGRALDQRDDDERAAIDKDVHDDVYQATGDAWRSLQARTGERILNAGRPSEIAADSQKDETP